MITGDELEPPPVATTGPTRPLPDRAEVVRMANA